MNSVDGLLLDSFIPPCVHHEHIWTLALAHSLPNMDARFAIVLHVSGAFPTRLESLQIESHASSFERDQEYYWLF